MDGRVLRTAWSNNTQMNLQIEGSILLIRYTFQEVTLEFQFLKKISLCIIIGENEPISFNRTVKQLVKPIDFSYF